MWSSFVQVPDSARRLERCPRCAYDLRPPPRLGTGPIRCRCCRLLVWPRGGDAAGRGWPERERAERPPVVLGQFLGNPILDRTDPPEPAWDDAARPGRADDARPRRVLDRLRTALLCLIALAAIVGATRGFMVVFQGIAHPAPGLLEGSTVAARRGAGDLARERALRIESVRRLDRRLAEAAVGAPERELWDELRRRDVEAIRLLERAPVAEGLGMAPPRAAGVGR